MKEQSKLTKRTSHTYKIALMRDFELQQKQKKTNQRNLSYLYKIELMIDFKLQQKQK